MDNKKTQIKEVSNFLERLKKTRNHSPTADNNFNEYKLICTNLQETECPIAWNLLVKTTNYMMLHMPYKLDFINSFSESNFKNKIILFRIKNILEKFFLNILKGSQFTGKQEFYLSLKLSAIESLTRSSLLDKPTRSIALNEINSVLVDSKSLQMSYTTNVLLISSIKSILKNAEPDDTFIDNSLDYFTKFFLQLIDLGRF